MKRLVMALMFKAIMPLNEIGPYPLNKLRIGFNQKQEYNLDSKLSLIWTKRNILL